MAFAEPYDATTRLNLNGLGWTYLTILMAWTFMLAGGIVFLFFNRNLPFLRIRNLPLSISAVAILHVYWCLCLIAYVLNGNFHCSTEFWIMSIYLPLGIALYQASNTQLRQVACLQERYASNESPSLHKKSLKPNGLGWRQPLLKWKSIPTTGKAMTLIAVGMVAQFVCALFAFCVSRQFHPSWGLTGHKVFFMQCRHGWAWWPSIVWQFTWSWIYAPYLLWKVRTVKDVHSWRLQTMLCSLAGLPASPMWLAALYVPKFAAVNRYFPPPMWFSICIALMEASVVCIPCIQVLRNHRLKKETLQIIAKWEKKVKRGDGSIESDSTIVVSKSILSDKTISVNTPSSRKVEMYTMGALEKTLEMDATALLLFAALKDFSGENISFLNHVRNWKNNWNPQSSRIGLLKKSESSQLQEDKILRRHQFSMAVEIYSSFVSLQYSEFPINISSAHHKELETMFEGAAALINAESSDDAATPFNSYWTSNHALDPEAQLVKNRTSLSSTMKNGSTDKILPSPDKPSRSDLQDVKLSDSSDKVPAWVDVPDDFDPNVFDHAEESIKYMVLTNTWPKFVSAGYATNSTPEKKRMWAWVKNSASTWFDVYGKHWTRLTQV